MEADIVANRHGAASIRPLPCNDLENRTGLALNAVDPMQLRPLICRMKGQLTSVTESVRDDHARRLERGRCRVAGRSIAAERGETDHLVVLEAQCARTHEADRADSALVDAWVLPVVAARGLAARAVLRHRIWQGHRELAGRYEALGRAARAGAALPPAPEPERPAVLKAPAGAEAARFGRAFWAQLRPALLPKAPALAGLAVGWWIANTYTDSRWKSLARSVGIGSGGTHLVSSETYRAMSFWLPLVAAALCAYLGDRIAVAIRERHESVSNE